MAKATVRMDLRPAGASLKVVARDLRRMDGRQVKDIFKRRLTDAGRPYPARVRASVLAIPTKPDGKHTGLRARIAQCVELSSGTDSKSAYVSVWVNPFRMVPDYKTLPLYMEGVKESRARNYSRWRHPIYGDRERWATQPAHPYFYQAASPLGRASGDAMRLALEDISRQIRG
jgi:hypothetical protein